MAVTSKLLRVTVPCTAILLLAACGGGGGGAGLGNSNGGGGGGTSTYTVGGTITGLGASGLVLVNGSDTVTVPANATTFTMPTSVANGQAYDITVKVHPAALDCTVASGAGTVNGADVTGISVSCQAGTESLVYSFAGGTADGANPWGSLMQASDGNLYGETESGGASNHGVVFKVTPGGVESVLHSFAGGTADGAHPQGGLIQASDGNFYGVTDLGGASGNGVVYRITPDGTESALYSFAGGTADGANPTSTLLQGSDGNFYGLTITGGANNAGTLFKITPSGTESILDSFIGNASAVSGGASVIQGSDGNLYCLISSGGAGGKGAFYRITLSGGMTLLYSFAGGPADGESPSGTPIQATDGNFYGATSAGGPSGIDGVVFEITPSGAETVLYSFAGGTTDGDDPQSGGPIQANDGNFYGVTTGGGASNYGVVYKLTPSGVETVLHSFSGGTTDGAYTYDNIIQASDGTLYGVTYSGGASGNGAIFEIN